MVPILVVLIGAAAVIAHHLAHMLELLTWLIMAEMAIFVGIGGVLRPITKMVYHGAFEGLTVCRRIAGVYGLRHWLWVTKQGRDRDA